VADLITALVLMVGGGSAAELVRGTVRRQLRNPVAAPRRTTALPQ
jgi:hypothetical protein